MEKAEESRGSIKVLHKGLKLIEFLAQQKTGVSLGRIAKELELPRSTVQRLVDSLVAEGWMDKGTENASLTLGARLMRLSWMIRQDEPIDPLKQILRKIHEATRETVACARLLDQKLHIVVGLESAEFLRAVMLPADHIPVCQSSLGKILLAGLAPQDQKTIMKSCGLSAMEQKKLSDEIKEVQHKGFAYDREECMPGISSVAVRLPAWGAEPLALAIVAPSVRYQEHAAFYEKVLKQASSDLRLFSEP